MSANNIGASFSHGAILIIGKLSVIAVPRLARGKDVNDFFRTQRDDRAQNRPIDQRKDRGIDADGEGEREHGNAGEAGGFEELTESEFEILMHTWLKIEMQTRLFGFKKRQLHGPICDAQFAANVAGWT